jgi:phosphatidylserine/phosphatidylglycerophosphate/cardiolipin synthase-like enzyme
VDVDGWFLTASERGNDATELDSRHVGAEGWTAGNRVEPLIHGATYFRRLCEAIESTGAGDVILFTDWRGDPDERLTEAMDVAGALTAAAGRGVVVRGLVWRSHLDRLRFSERENRHLGEAVDAAGGECLLDMRVRPGGSHHQKLVVVRSAARPERDVAFVGGIDLCHSRRDDQRHLGDPQSQTMAAAYGPTPPWHDLQLAITGPAVGDVECVFRERWNDPQPVSRNPLRRLSDSIHHVDTRPAALPPCLPDPQPGAGSCAVQLLRTYPARRLPYPFAPEGERSVARAYAKALGRARCLVYLEDQFVWSREVAEVFASALDAEPALRLLAVVPPVPDQDGRFSLPPNLYGRHAAVSILREAGGDRVALYALENELGTPIYVHAKVCIVDDVWATVGSDNFNRRSWTYDSELSAAVIEERRDDRLPADPGGLDDGARRFARQLRLELMAEHLGRDLGDDADLLDPWQAFDTCRATAEALDDWHQRDGIGPRPAGRLRATADPQLGRWTRAWSALAYRRLYDPDGRRRIDRRAGRF